MSITEIPHQAWEHVEDSEVRRKWCVENFQNIKVVSQGKQGTRHYEMGKIVHGFIAHLKDFWSLSCEQWEMLECFLRNKEPLSDLLP